MADRNKWKICFYLLMLLHQTFSYNQPKFCTQPSWKDVSTTFVLRAGSDAQRTALFIDRNNTVYIQRERSKQVEIRTKKRYQFISTYTC